MDGFTLVLANASNSAQGKGVSANAIAANIADPIANTQNTVAASFTQVGVGLHSGATVRVTVLPAAEHTGRVFVRTDQADATPIPATASSVVSTQMSTELGNGAVGNGAVGNGAVGNGAVTVRTVEHLLAALVAAGVDNARIEIDGPEVPLLDGSAQLWMEAIAQVGLQAQSAPRSSLTLTTPLWVQREDAFVVAFPAAEPRFTYGIDFPVAAIGKQWHSWCPSTESFSDTVASARTFTLAHHIEQLRQQGLIKGGSLDNALVCDAQTGWLNPPLRFPNEPVRHKLLDLIGDLSLLGGFPQAHVVAYKASHTLHTEFARRWQET
ncbi:MAG: UDP-3-O-acyl-N-acetylglucosamine deacetylase [Cyanothece sp. SIO2G6]|nr:UDP-3-O-acyl-N-acetylglucosamine deacetylase [Cyanothece sp. SIO2G6]